MWIKTLGVPNKQTLCWELFFQIGTLFFEWHAAVEFLKCNFSKPQAPQMKFHLPPLYCCCSRHTIKTNPCGYILSLKKRGGSTTTCLILKPWHSGNTLYLYEVVKTPEQARPVTQCTHTRLNINVNASSETRRLLKLRLIEYYPTKMAISKHSNPLVLPMPLIANQTATGCLPLPLTAVIVLA